MNRNLKHIFQGGAVFRPSVLRSMADFGRSRMSRLRWASEPNGPVTLPMGMGLVERVWFQDFKRAARIIGETEGADYDIESGAIIVLSVISN